MDDREMMAELAGLTPGQQIRSCRGYAQEARQLAKSAEGELRSCYERLAAGWERMAHAIEQGRHRRAGDEGDLTLGGSEPRMLPKASIPD